MIKIQKMLEVPLSQGQEAEKEALQLTLHVKEGAIVSLENDKNQARQYTYPIKNPRGYGQLKGTVTTQAPGFILQLLDEHYEVVAEVRNQHQYEFSSIAPGQYRLRVIVLQAPDADWDPGNILEQRLPDPVLFHPEGITILPNWQETQPEFQF